MSALNLGVLNFKFDVDTAAGKQKLTGVAGELDKFGSKMTSVGKKMTTAITLPLTALGVASVTTFAKFEQSMAQVQSTCSGSAREMEILSNKARELGQSTKFSASEVADGFNFMAMAGWSAQEMLAGIDHTLNLSIASGSDLALVTDIVTDSLTGMGMSAQQTGEFVDIVAQTSRNANTNVEMMGETLKYCAPTAGGLGISMQELSLAIGLMANSGIKGSQAGTTLRSGLVNLVKPTDQMAAAMDKYGIELKKNADGSSDLKGTMVNLREALKDVEKQEQANAVATIFGKQAMAGWQAIINTSEKDFNRLSSAIDNSSGSADEMAEIMGDTFTGKVNNLKSSFEEFMIVIGEKLLPLATGMINKLTDMINWFNGLDESTQKSIVTFGVLAAGIGPVILLIGKLSTGIANLSVAMKGLTASKIISKITALNPVTVGLTAAVAGLVAITASCAEYNELLGTTVLDTTDNMSWFEKAISKVTGVQKYSKEELIEMGLAYRDFSDNVSAEFVTALENNQKAVYNFNAELQRVNLDDVLDEEEASKLNSDIENLTTGVINLIKEKGVESRNALADCFKVDDDKIDENEQIVLDALNRIETESITEVTTLKDEIQGIYQNALDKKRGLSEQEIADVAEKHERLRQAELEALALTHEEQLIAQNTFGARIRNMDLENAVELATQKATERDTNIANTRGYYDSKITLLQENLSKMTEEERIAAEAEILQLTTKRDDAITLENQMWQGILEQIALNNPAVLEQMNEFNGTLLTENDKKNQKLLSAQEFAYENMNTITADGTYKVKSTIDGSMKEITVNVDESTGKILGIYDHSTKQQFGYTQEQGKNIAILGEKHGKLAGEIQVALAAGEKAYVGASGVISTESGLIIGQLEDVKTAADGTKEGFVNINGTPVQIKTNAEGVITNLNDVTKAVNNIPSEKNISIKETTYKKTINQNPMLAPMGSSRPQSLDANILAMESRVRDLDTYRGIEQSSFANMREYTNSNNVFKDLIKKMALTKEENLININNEYNIKETKLDIHKLAREIQSAQEDIARRFGCNVMPLNKTKI